MNKLQQIRDALQKYAADEAECHIRGMTHIPKTASEALSTLDALMETHVLVVKEPTDKDYTSPLRPKRLEYTMCGKIYAVQENGEHHMFLDVRGWGYLTGGGAKKLPFEEATAIQDKWANEVVTLWNNIGKQPDVNQELLDALRLVKLDTMKRDEEMFIAGTGNKDHSLETIGLSIPTREAVQQAIARAEKEGA